MTHAFSDLVRDIFESFHSFLMNNFDLTSKSAGIIILFLGIGVGIGLLYSFAKYGANKDSQD